MAKKESTFINMVLTLFGCNICSISSIRDYVYELTKDPIAAAKLAKNLNKQLSKLFLNLIIIPHKNHLKIMPVDGDSLNFYPAKKNGELVGTAIKTFTNKGFSGSFKIMVGFLPDGTINNISSS